MKFYQIFISGKATFIRCAFLHRDIKEQNPTVLTVPLRKLNHDDKNSLKTYKQEPEILKDWITDVRIWITKTTYAVTKAQENMPKSSC